MAAQNPSLETIEDFLAQKRIAMVGISREPRSFSVMLFEELCRRGYDVIPVNPNIPNVLGRTCFARLQDIQPPVQAALLMTSPAVTDTVVSDCAEAGIRRVWMYRATGSGAVSPKAVAFCQERGIQVVPDNARLCSCRLLEPFIASTVSSAKLRDATRTTTPPKSVQSGSRIGEAGLCIPRAQPLRIPMKERPFRAA